MIHSHTEIGLNNFMFEIDEDVANSVLIAIGIFSPFFSLPSVNFWAFCASAVCTFFIFLLGGLTSLSKCFDSTSSSNYTNKLNFR